ncbi:hypothetical protein [Novosphingobium resinovorum]|uniref:Uncharacterized protein n=1 Tax=Novosphingobium resinovorum TaxID=158500 RepID=A0A1D8A2Y4_9SPHN|nr:hypothetical protein [Novosphingobium resinovorum]AOR76513.1 hypothetical protein BES08_06980 [Novosphingobium resinovorum]
MSFFDPARTLIVDTECVANFWSIGFRRVSDAKTLIIEHSERRPMTEAQQLRIRNLIMNNTIVTYNGIGYDMIMIFLAAAGASNAELKAANDKIIVGGMKYWHARDLLGVEVPRDCFLRKDGSQTEGLHHFDLMEPQPNARASLKTLQGRLHGRKMQEVEWVDRPFTYEEMDQTLAYMGNDLEATHNVFDALIEPLALRDTFSREYGINLMSKSDAQMGEAIIKRRVEQETGEKVFKVETPPGTTFKFKAPEYLQFEPGSELSAIFERVKQTDFMVLPNGKVELPEWLSDRTIDIGVSKYQMGIGGLHSTEKNRSVHADDEFALVDFDVASYYPRIIINSGLYPKALGPAFLKVFSAIADERLGAKQRIKAIDEELKSSTSLTAPALNAERARVRAVEAGLKIALNGTFGKLGSPYSVLYAPHLLITTTLTGQFALLMLIQRAEAMGISIVSANTDGVVMRIPRSMIGPIKRDRVTEGAVKNLIEQWEVDTGFVMEATPYRSIFNRSVNDYIAIKEDGAVKWKGVVANPWRSGDGFKPDLRGQLMKNPQMPIIANAVVDHITKGTPLEETIRSGTDVRDFITVVNVQGGGTWRGEFLGKVVRYYWAHGGEEILRAKPHERTGNFAKVSKTDGCRPLMELTGEFPPDVDYETYIQAAREVLMDIGFNERPPAVKPLRVYKYNAIGWFAVAA